MPSMLPVSPSSKSVILTCIAVLALPIFAAVLLQNYMFAGLTPPPSDYGKGTMFDVIAVRYDMINRILAAGMDIGWRQRMVAKIRESPLVVEATTTTTTTTTTIPAPPLQLLDVATGTADVALLLASVIPSANITGVDPSENMLHVGRHKIEQQQSGLDHKTIHLVWHDAQTLSQTFVDGTFDGATMAFGIRNVPNRSLALCQIHSVLKPQARFCILEFSEPDETNGWLGAAARLFIRYIIPVVGGLLSGKPREYWHLQSSIKDFPSPKEFGELIEGLECPNGSFQLNELVHMNFGSVQLYVTTALQKPAGIPIPNGSKTLTLYASMPHVACMMQQRVAMLWLLLSLLSLPLEEALFVTTPSIDSFTLFDVDTQQHLGVLVNGTKVNLAMMGGRNLSIRVETTGNHRRIRSLVVQIDGTTELSFQRSRRGSRWNVGTFHPTLQDNNIVPALLRVIGTYTITATARYRLWGRQQQQRWRLTTLTSSVTVVQPNSTVEVKPPTASPQLVTVSPTMNKTVSPCGGAVNTGFSGDGETVNKCRSDLWSPTGDASMHCFAYGGSSDPCSLNNNNDVNHGLGKNPAACRGDTFYLWDEPDTQGKNYTWAGIEWVKYANRFSTEIRALRQAGVQFTSPLVKAGETGITASRLRAFYAACGKPCHDPSSSAYIHIHAVNAFAGPWNRPGLDGCRDAAKFITQEVRAIENTASLTNTPRRPWYLTNWSRLGTSNVSAQVDAMNVLPLFFASNSPIQRVYWFGATDYGGGSSNNFLTTLVSPNGPSLGDVWKQCCDKL